MRIVSLIASATEIVAALGKADQLVGISHECDWPPKAVVGRAVLTRPGPRILESLHILAGIFHEDLFKGKIPSGSVVALGT